MKKKIFLGVLIFVFLFAVGSDVQAAKKSKKYFLHKNIVSSYFWVGEDFGDGTIGSQSTWDSNWLLHFGGEDTPFSRKGYRPKGFIPKENPFYVSLPYSDFGVYGRKASAKKIPWYSAKKAAKSDYSFVKNRWIKISKNGRSAYAQVEDAGPGSQDDFNYVFGKSKPQYSVGIDVSPAVKDYLKLSDLDIVSWRFVSFKDVSKGPWKNIITTRMISWAGSDQ